MNIYGDFLKHHHRLLLLLKSCSKTPSIRNTKPLHALVITLGPNSSQTTFLFNNVISIYASVGELSSARKVFDKMPERNVVSFNTIISSYSRCGYVGEAWRLFYDMRNCGCRSTQFTLGGLLSCDLLDLCKGVQLHALIVKNGLFIADAFVGTALLGLYGRHESLHEAVCAFEDMPKKSIVTWNSIISIFGRYGFVEDCIFFFRDLVREKIPLSEGSFVGVLSGFICEQYLGSGEQIHGLVIKNGFDNEVLVVNSVINMYVKCMHVSSAEKMFELNVGDVVSWNTIIGALVKNGKPEKALEFFLRMSSDQDFQNGTTFVYVINSIAALQIAVSGKSIHAKIIKTGLECDAFVGSALVDFYAKCDNLEDAQLSFDEISDKNVVSWNSLILGYANKYSSTSMFLLIDMLQLGYQPNEFTFSHVLKSSFTFELSQLHCLIIRMGYQSNEYVLSSLMSSYAKNGLISDAIAFATISNSPIAVVPSNIIAGIYNRLGQYHEALKLLSLLEEPDIVSWNTAIAACAHNGYYTEVFELFKYMQLADIHPDNCTFVSLLSACTKLCNLTLGCSLHALIIKADINRCDTFLFNVLIDMYGKCGSIGSSIEIFKMMTDRNIITWTTLISALGLNGFAYQALEKFREMEILGFKPDRVAVLAVLTACRHGGLVTEGMELFGRMKSTYGVEPEMDHYHCLVDLLAKDGHLKEAEKIIATMPFPPNALVWRSFLGGCRRQKTVEYGAVG
ncbi:pentatricopeptide repeat-containing protein At3g58590-like [Pistacia vera]|uniref:pentatricopeptide repeat-containing protein At3g58590-like n=1 Tax=Pistacia vera TaxID=55513 RepID=UPI0012631024|nr:pentatricopeptide repeat-containing protein At3g58590-like [Pistacia vera]